MRSSVRDEAFFRLGASVLGLFAGTAIAFLLFAPLVIGGLAQAPLSRWAFAGGVAGAVVGIAIPATAVLAFEGLIHFLAGVFIALAGGDVPAPSHERPQWLVAALWVGVVYLLAAWLVLHLGELLTRYPS